MSDIEVYSKDITRKDEFEFKGKVCPFMSGVGPACRGSAWKGIVCIQEKCMAWVTSYRNTQPGFFASDNGHCRRLE
jgi:hypothetical protein